MLKDIGKSIKRIFGRKLKSSAAHQASKDEAPDALASRLYQLYANDELTKEQVDAVLELKKQKESGTMSTIDCRAKVYKIISALSVEEAIGVLNEI